jgi:hypothetical protein
MQNLLHITTLTLNTFQFPFRRLLKNGFYVILNEVKDLKSLKIRDSSLYMRIHFCIFHFIRFEGVNVSIAIALYAWFHGTDSS